MKRLNEVVYRIKYCGTAGRYFGVKRRVAHFNQLKHFHGTNDKGKSCIVAEKEPLLTGMVEGSGVIVLEDDVFPRAVAVASSEDPGTVRRSLQEEGQLRRCQRERRPPVWTLDFQRTLKLLFRTF